MREQTFHDLDLFFRHDHFFQFRQITKLFQFDASTIHEAQFRDWQVENRGKVFNRSVCQIEQLQIGIAQPAEFNDSGTGEIKRRNRQSGQWHNLADLLAVQFQRKSSLFRPILKDKIGCRWIEQAERIADELQMRGVNRGVAVDILK